MYCNIRIPRPFFTEYQNTLLHFGVLIFCKKGPGNSDITVHKNSHFSTKFRYIIIYLMQFITILMICTLFYFLHPRHRFFIKFHTIHQLLPNLLSGLVMASEYQFEIFPGPCHSSYVTFVCPGW